MKKKIAALLAGAALMLAAGSAMAIPITGTISFAPGHAQLLGGTPVPGLTAFQYATKMHFVNAKTDQFGSDGIYASIADGTVVTYADFIFRPSLPGTITPLWTFTTAGETYSFDMSSVTATSTANSLALHGSGTLYAVGSINYDATPGVWDFTTQNGLVTALSFSATSAPVPEPGTMVLLGAGLLGLAIFGKRRMNKEV